MASQRKARISERFDDLGRDGAACRLGIMGGTFDPVHFGHLLCAERARELAGLDAVLFIPTATPSFKRDRRIASGEARLEMCRLATYGNPCFDVSPIEVERGGITYACDTLRELREHYPQSVELCYIVGADAAATLPRWHHADEIVRIASYIAVSRPGASLAPGLLDELSRAGFRVEAVKAQTLSVSSTELRERAARGESLRYLVPDSVRAYIEKQHLYEQEEGVCDEH